jgi:hypothetical protein
MGYKGTIRSINSALNQAQRAAARRQRELQREEKQRAQMQERQRAAHDVAVYENHIEVLTSVHKQVSDPIEWESLATASPPLRPEFDASRTETAVRRLRDYEPRGFDKLGKRAERKRQALTREVEEARQADEATYREQLAEYERAHADWEETKRLAEGVLAGDAQAYIDAVQDLGPFSDMGALGSKVSLKVLGPKIVQVTVHVHGEEVVPKQARTLLKSGKLSMKAMPKARFHEIYEDYVCGAAIRSARELCSLLPIDVVLVETADELLNTATGRLEEQTILSVVVPRATLDNLNLELIDPSDALANFLHRVNFKKTSGFTPVDPLTVADAAKLQEQ